MSGTGDPPTRIPGWTRLGTLDGPGEPIVDRRGALQVAPGRPRIDWLIAGDDRWYLPAEEQTVRQSLLGNTPVVETRMRVRGGDVCLRSYAVTVPTATGTRDVVVLEIENATGVPCGAAFAVRPDGIVGDAPVGRCEIRGGVLRADGDVALVLPREPAGCLAGTARSDPLGDRVRRGEATGTSFAPVDCPQGRAEAVVVVPLAHRNVFRVVVPVPEPDGTLAGDAGEFPAVPPAENVARGWRAQVSDLARVRVPDPRLHAVGAAAAPWLLATTNHADAAVGRSVWDTDRSPRWHHVAAVSGALDRIGGHDRSGLLLARAAIAHDEHPDGDASWLVEAFGAHLVRTGDPGFAAAVAETSAGIVGLIETGRLVIGGARRVRVLHAAAAVFAAADQPGAAAAARSAAASVFGPDDVDEVGPGRCAEALAAQHALAAGDTAGTWDRLDRWLDEVTSTGVWSDTDDPAAAGRHDMGVTGAVVSVALDLLVAAVDGEVRFVGHVPAAWSGRPIEAERVVTPLGATGFAVRWHGDRPALLWECVPRPGVGGGSGQLVVRATGLDPDWRGEGRSGEALLGVHDAGRRASSGGARISGLQIGRSRSGA